MHCLSYTLLPSSYPGYLATYPLETSQITPSSSTVRGAKPDYSWFCLIRHYVYLNMIGSLISRDTNSDFQIHAEGFGFALLHEREGNVIFYLFGFVSFLTCFVAQWWFQNKTHMQRGEKDHKKSWFPDTLIFIVQELVWFLAPWSFTACVNSPTLHWALLPWVSCLFVCLFSLPNFLKGWSYNCLVLSFIFPWLQLFLSFSSFPINI